MGSWAAVGLRVRCRRAGAEVKTLRRRRGRDRGGWPCAPAAGAGGGWGWGGARRVGPCGSSFCLVPLPLSSEQGDGREGGTAASRVSDPHALLPKGAPRARRFSSLLPASLELFPAPPPAEDGCPGLGGGRVIASAAPYSRCPFYPSLALPAPPGCTSPPPALPGGRQH